MEGWLETVVGSGCIQRGEELLEYASVVFWQNSQQKYWKIQKILDPPRASDILLSTKEDM